MTARSDMPQGGPLAVQWAPQAADPETFEEVHSTEHAQHVRDTTGHIDEDNQCAVVEQGQFDYETVAASQTDQVLGVTGAAGDFLHKVIIVPATTSPGAISIKDGSGSSITIFAGGASSVADLKPIPVEFNIRSTNGAWKLTTGANVSALGIGRFTP